MTPLREDSVRGQCCWSMNSLINVVKEPDWRLALGRLPKTGLKLAEISSVVVSDCMASSAHLPDEAAVSVYC